MTSKMPPRIDVQIPAGRARLGGWLYPSFSATAVNPGPAIVLGHGLGAIMNMGLDKYAALFQQQGYTCVCFDYRGFGASTGSPRQILDWYAQEEDWHTAILYTRGLEAVDPEQVGIFGSSFGGGHAISIASQDKRLKAAISQCPFTSGFASANTLGLTVTPRLAFRALRDLLFRSEDDYIPIKLAGKPGEVALMNAHDAQDGYLNLVPSDIPFNDEVAARVGLQVPFLYPGARAKNVECPIYFAVCKNDTVAPAGPTLKYAAKAPRGVVKIYDLGHFSIYVGAGFEEATKDYVEFLRKHLPVTIPAKL